MSKLMKFYDIFNHIAPLSPTFLHILLKKGLKCSFRHEYHGVSLAILGERQKLRVVESGRNPIFP